MSTEGIVDVTTTEMSIVGRGFDDELAFWECNDGDGHGRVTNIDKEDLMWIPWIWEVGLCDTPTEGCDGNVIDDAEGVEAGGVQPGTPITTLKTEDLSS